jgi:hypothetical protein
LGETRTNYPDFPRNPTIVEKGGFGPPLSTKEPPSEIDPVF